MARKDAQDRSAGFTIVETLLVVAVGGLIMLITIMAIPALERSSHNNARRQDVQAILAAVSRYKLNNSGSMPDSASNFLKYTKLTSYSSTAVYLSGGGGTPTTDGINVHSELPNTGPMGETNNSLDTVDIYNYRKCSTNPVGDSTNGGAGFSDVVALYALEIGSGAEPHCQQM